MFRCLCLRLELLALLLRRIATVQAPKDEGARNFVISEHGGFQHGNPRLLRVDMSKFPSRRNNDLWERFGFGSWMEDVGSETSPGPAMVSLAQQIEEFPAAVFDLKDNLPVSQIQQNIAQIDEDKWPVNFCMNATIMAPDASSNPIPGENQKVIALVGGGAGFVANGTDSCGNFMIFVEAGDSANAVGMGVSSSGNDWTGNNPCTQNFISDAPVITTTKMLSGQQYDLTFCYDSAEQTAQIYMNGMLELSAANKMYVFPREGAVTLLAGSHSGQQEVLQTTLYKFSISPYPTTTTTTTSGPTTTTTKTVVYMPSLFHLPNTPRVIIDQQTAEFVSPDGSDNTPEWPEDFCISVNITAPSVQSGRREIGLFGSDDSGTGRCNSFAIFFDNRNVVGMGGTCQTGGGGAGANSDPLLTTVSLTGTHFISFCYAKQEGKASIIVDGQVATNDDRIWTYQRTGFVTIFGGSHIPGSNFEELQEATLWSLDIVECTPGQMPPLSSNSAQSGGQSNSGNDGSSGSSGSGGSTAVTSTTVNLTQAIRDALGETSTTTTSTTTLGTTTTTITTTLTTTTTVTTTVEPTHEHVVVVDNSSDTVTNHSSHHHSEDTSVQDHGNTHTWSRHISGDERPFDKEDNEDDSAEDNDQPTYVRYYPVDA
mmetsp:Transcript_798/g.1324  ORF Transcript_798/g.1324 Transcript_798/m.1324 type:complete len:653 (-) Transcript_798:46-2004(-)